MRLVRLVLPLVALSLSGCVVAAAGAAGYGAAKYFSNGETRTYSGDLATVLAATKDELRAQGFPLPVDVPPGPGGITLTAGDAKVDVARVNDTVTNVEVTVGTFSSEEHAVRGRAILDGISRRLGQPIS